MKITFLGTAAGLPAKNRATASTVIEVGEKLYLIDAGMPVVNRLIDFGFDLEAVKAVFITHTHTDHVLGLLDLIRCVNIEKIFPTAEIDYYTPEDSLVTAIDSYFNAVIQPIRYEVNRFHTYGAGVIFDDGTLRVSAIPTAHMAVAGKPSFAFLVEAEGKRVVFSGDLSSHLTDSDIPGVVYDEDVDLFVLELAHFSIDELKAHIDGMKMKKLVFNHISFFEKKLPDIEAFKAENKAFDVEYSFDGYTVTL